MLKYTDYIFADIQTYADNKELEVLTYKRKVLLQLYTKLKSKQKIFFNRIFKSTSNVKEEDLLNAIRLCASTIETNENDNDIDDMFNEIQ